MALSQNLIFEGKCSHESDPDHPGKEIVDFLYKDLPAKGWAVSELNIWRDSGWSFESSKEDAQLEVVLVEYNKNNEQWLLQIFRTYKPGFIGKLMNKKPSATEKDILELANSIHEIITKKYRNSKWRWDGDPGDPKWKKHSAIPEQKDETK